jgi:hypothetical protein
VSAGYNFKRRDEGQAYSTLSGDWTGADRVDFTGGQAGTQVPWQSLLVVAGVVLVITLAWKKIKR